MKIAWIDALRNCNPSRVQTRGLGLVYEPPHEPVHWEGTGKYRDETELTHSLAQLFTDAIVRNLSIVVR